MPHIQRLDTTPCAECGEVGAFRYAHAPETEEIVLRPEPGSGYRYSYVPETGEVLLHPECARGVDVERTICALPSCTKASHGSPAPPRPRPFCSHGLAPQTVDPSQPFCRDCRTLVKRAITRCVVTESDGIAIRQLFTMVLRSEQIYPEFLRAEHRHSNPDFIHPLTGVAQHRMHPVAYMLWTATLHVINASLHFTRWRGNVHLSVRYILAAFVRYADCGMSPHPTPSQTDPQTGPQTDSCRASELPVAVYTIPDAISRLHATNHVASTSAEQARLVKLVRMHLRGTTSGPALFISPNSMRKATEYNVHKPEHVLDAVRGAAPDGVPLSRIMSEHVDVFTFIRSHLRTGEIRMLGCKLYLASMAPRIAGLREKFSATLPE